MSKLSQYSELPVVIRLTETGQELSFVASPRGGSYHVSGSVGAETFEGFIKVEPIATEHPDIRWDVRVTFCIPADAAAAPVTTVTNTGLSRYVANKLDVDGAPAVEEIVEPTDNEKYLLDDVRVDPFEQAREINDAMPDATKAPVPGEEDALEELAREVRASSVDITEEEAMPPEDFIASETPPSVGEEEELGEKLAARAAARGRRVKR